MISIIVGHVECKHRCHGDENVPIAFMLPSNWQDGA